jgi:hypothetical protein
MQAIVHPDPTDAKETASAETLIFGVDEDEQTWRVWNDYTRALAVAAGAPVVTEATVGPQFAVMSPLTVAPGHARIVPRSSSSRNIAGLVRRTVIDPRAVYTWSLAHRRDDDHPQRLNFRECAARVADEQGWLRPPHPVWIPPYDIHSTVVEEINSGHTSNEPGDRPQRSSSERRTSVEAM